MPRVNKITQNSGKRTTAVGVVRLFGIMQKSLQSRLLGRANNRKRLAGHGPVVCTKP